MPVLDIYIATRCFPNLAKHGDNIQVPPCNTNLAVSNHWAEPISADNEPQIRSLVLGEDLVKILVFGEALDALFEAERRLPNCSASVNAHA